MMKNNGTVATPTHARRSQGSESRLVGPEALSSWRLLIVHLFSFIVHAAPRRARAERPSSKDRRSLALTPSGGHLAREDAPTGSQRREFSPEYKDEAVKLVINTGRPVATVARELGVKEQTLGRWELA
jgi:hypothetical protein